MRHARLLALFAVPIAFVLLTIMLITTCGCFEVKTPTATVKGDARSMIPPTSQPAK